LSWQVMYYPSMNWITFETFTIFSCVRPLRRLQDQEKQPSVNHQQQQREDVEVLEDAAGAVVEDVDAVVAAEGDAARMKRNNGNQ